MTDSYIESRDGKATSFVGPDAVNLMRAKTLKHGIKFYAETGMKLTRYATISDMLRMAGEYTGKSYKGKKDYERAVADMDIWIKAMESAIPIIQK